MASREKSKLRLKLEAAWRSIKLYRQMQMLKASKPKLALHLQPRPNVVGRRFLGKIKDFVDKQEQRFEQKHLKAYLRGYERFQYGYKDVVAENGIFLGREPVWHDVKQQLILAK